MNFTRQSDYRIRLEWGHRGLEGLAEAELATIVIVDVLSFSTCVSVAVDRGALVLPYPSGREGAEGFAEEHEAILAGGRFDPKAALSLAPSSLTSIPAGTRLVLPSPNGSSLSFDASGRGTVVAGCLRNRSAVAAYCAAREGPVAIIAAGERWPDGSLRPCLEDHIGAGSIVAALPGSRSPEAEAASEVFAHFSSRIEEALMASSSGRELVQRGIALDVAIASAVDASDRVPVLHDGCYR